MFYKILVLALPIKTPIVLSFLNSFKYAFGCITSIVPNHSIIDNSTFANFQKFV